MYNFFRNIINVPNLIFNYIVLKINNVQKIKIYGRLTLINKGKFIIGANAKINSGKFYNIIGGDTRSAIIISKDALLEIGDNFKLSNSNIYCKKNIKIGDNVMIGGGCKIWDSDFHSINYFNRCFGEDKEVSAEILIEDNVFVGAHTIILKGVHIGKNSVIGAGSVVSKNIPENEIWAGNPIQFIKKLYVYENKDSKISD